MSAADGQIRCVALLSPAWPPDAAPNGIVTYTAAMKGAFERMGVRAVVVVPAIGADSRDVVFAMKRPGLATRAWGKVASRWRGAAADGMGGSLAAAARRLRASEGVELIEMEESFGWCGEVAERGGVPVVGRLHGPWFLNGPAVGAPKDAAYEARVEKEREGILRCQGITSPSKDVLEQTRRFYGIDLPGAEAIPCPIEPRPEAERWREDRCEPELILFVGRFDRHKAGDVMLDAFAMVAAKRPRARLVFAGPDRGCTRDDGRTWSMPDYLERLPGAVRERIEWLGFRPNKELPALRRQAAVTVVCSRYENFGYAVLEGLAHGCPMVVSRTGGLVEMVEHERSALLCVPGSVESLAEQIDRMLDDRALAVRAAAQGLKNVEERFHPDAVARKTMAFYARMRGMNAGSARSSATAGAVPLTRV